MGESKTPVINPALINFALRLRLLSSSGVQDKPENQIVKPAHYYTWAFGFLSNLAFGWIIANLIAVHGLKYTRSLDVEHSDWALQTYDFAVNFLVIAAIFLAQISWFISARLADDDFKGIVSRGKLFFVPHLLVVGCFVLLALRLNQLPSIEYPYYLPNPFVFCVAWTIAATIFFLGLSGFWRFIGMELYRDIKKKFWD
jgi:hypothetical protein